jgi:hypothetical protein
MGMEAVYSTKKRPINLVKYKGEAIRGRKVRDGIRL